MSDAEFTVKQETYTCALNDQKYCGGCQIAQCHAHLSASRHPSQCLYLFYDNKKSEFDRYDIMYAFDIKDKAYRNLYNEGWEKATTLVTLFKLLNFLRDKNKKRQCPQCGIFRSDVTSCTNPPVCQQRQKILHNVFNNSNLKYPEMRASYKDLYLLLHYRSGVEIYLKELKNNVKPNLYSLFGLESNMLDHLLKIPTEAIQEEKGS